MATTIEIPHCQKHKTPLTDLTCFTCHGEGEKECSGCEFCFGVEIHWEKCWQCNGHGFFTNSQCDFCEEEEMEEW